MGLFSRTKNVDIFFIGCDGTDIDRGIYAFYLDRSNGKIIRKSFVKSQANPMMMKKNGRWMYISYRNSSGKVTDGGIHQYASMDLQLGLSARVSYEGKTYADICVNKDASYLYAVDYYNGEVVKTGISKSKVIKIFPQHKLEGKSKDPIKQTESHPSSITFDKDYNKVIVTDLGGDEVIVYDVVEKNNLQKNEQYSFKVKEGSGPKKVIFNSEGNLAFVLNEISSTLQLYTYENGLFTFKSEVSTYLKEEYSGENIPTDITIMENDKFIFVTNKGDDTVVVFEIDEDTYDIQRIDCIEVAKGPKNMLIFNDKYLVVTSKQAGVVESFEIRYNERNGILFETNSTFSLHAPECIVMGNKDLRVV